MFFFLATAARAGHPGGDRLTPNRERDLALYQDGANGCEIKLKRGE